MKTTAYADELTQREAAKRLIITQPRISSLFKGAWGEFSMDSY
jgi:predicted XRE-type DNA-binding protein